MAPRITSATTAVPQSAVPSAVPAAAAPALISTKPPIAPAGGSSRGAHRGQRQQNSPQLDQTLAASGAAGPPPPAAFASTGTSPPRASGVAGAAVFGGGTQPAAATAAAAAAPRKVSTLGLGAGHGGASHSSGGGGGGSDFAESTPGLGQLRDRDDELRKSVSSEHSLNLRNFSARKQRNFVMIAGRRKDLNELKREAISHSTIKITRNFKKIVQSKEFDSFLTSGAHYSLWFARTLHLERLSSGNALMSAHADSMAARNKTPIFGDVTCSLDECRRHKAKFLQEFARSYCFLLLHISRNSVEPAKERAYFENIYIFTQKIVVALIEFPAFSSLVEAELNRMFRSELFCGVDSLIDDPVGMMKSGHLLQLRSGGAAGGLSGAATAAVDSSGTASMKVGLAAGAGAGGESSGVVTRDAWMTVPAAGAAGIGSRPFSSTSARPESSRPTHGGGYARRPSGGGSTSVRPNSSSTTGSPPEPVRLRTRKSVGVGGEPGRASQLSRPVPLQRIVQAREEQQQHHDGAEDSAVQPAQDEGQANDSAEPDSESILVPASKVVKKTRRKRISLNDVRMARSPLADAILPPPQRFLFVQTHARF